MLSTLKKFAQGFPPLVFRARTIVAIKPVVVD